MTGLVLEGGGMRGLYTAGIIDIMIDHGFEPDVICATSAGATFGVNLPSKQRGRTLRYNMKYIGRKGYVSFYSLLTTGNIINVDFSYNKIPNQLDRFDEEAFCSSKTKLYVTVTNTKTGEAEYIHIKNCSEQIDAIRASASIPYLSKKVNINGNTYLDGGIVDNIPLTKCQELGCDKIIVVLTRPAGYRKNGKEALLSKLWYPADKNLQNAFKQRNINYNKRLEEIEKLEDNGEILVIRPSEDLKIRRLEKNRQKLLSMYDLGISDATNIWSKIEQYLNR